MQDLEILVHRDGVSNAHTLFGGLAGIAADVDVQIGDLGCLGLAVHALHVRWRITHHAETGPWRDGYPLGLADNGVDAAHPFHENKAVVVDIIHRKGDLVSVAGEHNARAPAFVECGDAVAVFVVIGFIGELGNVIEPHALAAGFVAGWAGGIDEFLQKGERFLAHGRRVHVVRGGVNARR